MKLLLIEDDIDLCQNIKEQLSKEGYLIDTFDNGEEGFVTALNPTNAYDLTTLFLAHFIVGIAVKPTEAAIRSQKEFTASVSHELKSPLAVILSSAEVISRYDKLPAQYLHQTQIIDSECLRMSKLIQDLLLLSSIDTRTWSLNKTNVNIDSLMIGVYEKFEPICKKHNVMLNLDLEEMVFPAFLADADRLDQILSIFWDNAITFSAPDTEILLKEESNH